MIPRNFGGNSSISLHASPKSNLHPNLEEIFKCFICYGKVQSPHLCPSCSKVCCFDCMKKWLGDQSKNFCPHCRAPLRLSQLVNCRIINEISAELEKLQMKSKSPSKTLEKCKSHNLPLTYYCETCKTPVCSDCAMFGEKHKSHSFKHIKDVYDKHVEIIKKESSGLKNRLKELHDLLKGVIDNIESVTKAKEERSIEIRKTLSEMQERLDQELKSKLLNLMTQKGVIGDEIELVQKMLHELQTQIENSSQSDLISKTPDIRRMLQEVHKKPASRFSKGPVSSRFTSEIVPTYDCGSFKISSYMKLKNTKDVIYSPPMVVNGLSWRLKVYPNGTGGAQGSYLSVFLEMWKGLKNPTKYEYRVEMMNQRNIHNSIVREFSSVFEVGECWGYNRFYKIDLLAKEGFLDVENDSVTFKFYVRAPSFFEKCKEQSRYISQLEEQISQLDELKQRIAEESLKNKELAKEDETNSSQETVIPPTVNDMEEHKNPNAHVKSETKKNEQNSPSPTEEKDGNAKHPKDPSSSSASNGIHNHPEEKVTSTSVSSSNQSETERETPSNNEREMESVKKFIKKSLKTFGTSEDQRNEKDQSIEHSTENNSVENEIIQESSLLDSFISEADQLRALEHGKIETVTAGDLLLDSQMNMIKFTKHNWMRRAKKEIEGGSGGNDDDDDDGIIEELTADHTSVGTRLSEYFVLSDEEREDGNELDENARSEGSDGSDSQDSLGSVEDLPMF